MNHALDSVLRSREARWNELRKLAGDAGVRAIITVSLNIPGPEKNGKPALYWMAVSEGMRELIDAAKKKGWNSETIIRNAGPAGTWAAVALVPGIDAAPIAELKRAAEDIERDHPLGRALDLDVIDSSNDCTPLERTKKRSCVICGGNVPAFVCIREGKHEWKEVLEKMDSLIVDYFDKKMRTRTP